MLSAHVAASFASLASLTLAAAPLAWQAAAPGAERLTIYEDDVEADLLRFDLVRYRPEVVVLANGAKTAATLRAETGAAAVVNGGFFDPSWRPLGLRIARGKTLVPLRRRVDWGVLVLRVGHAEIVHSREFQADPTVDGAIQVGPRLLVGGQPLKLKPQRARRTAVALDREGKTFTLVVTRRAADAQRLATLLARLGFDSALMLDGGPSTQLSAVIGAIRIDLPGGYAVPDALVIRKRP